MKTKKHPIRNRIILFLVASLFFISCNSDDDSGQDFSSTFTFDIFTVQSDRETVLMRGEIKSRTLRDFRNMLAGHPNIKLINMATVPGSNDDAINFQVGKLLRQNNINTHVLDNNFIASGGVDFFLAGVQRSRGSETRFGVHSWSDGNGRQATDFPMDSSEHDANINYYVNLGYSAQWSRDFYFFTINAASADDIHWMTEGELQQYNLFTE